MEQIVNFINNSPGSAILTLVVLFVFLAIFTIWQTVQAKKLRSKWAALLTGNTSVNLEVLLERHLVELQVIQDQVHDSCERIETLEKKIRSAKRYVGLVKYDAFEDVGGSQSFSLAIYDEEGNGSVLTSLVGREGCRVYGKVLVNGKSDRHLSTEEEMAIEQATSARSRPRISP